MQVYCTFLTLLIAVALLVVACASASQLPQMPDAHPNEAPLISTDLRTITGTFENQITNLEKNMPSANSEGYVIPPEQAQADFALLVKLINSRDLVRATDLAAANRYTLSYYQDLGDDNAVSYLLREQKPIQKGWGLYAFRKDSASNIIIEATHPRADKRSLSVALDLYRALHGRALLIGGAHRYANQDESADVAHASKSIFQSVHIALLQEMQAQPKDVIILQIHGFHSTKHSDYPQVVLGLGNNALPQEITLAEKIQEALAEQGISAGICLGETLTDLCGETNIQGAVTEKAAFLHIELDENLRKEDKAFVAALVQVFHK